MLSANGDGAACGTGRATLYKTLSAAADAFTILASVTDIVTDVLVLREFHGLGYYSFFKVSAAVFALAQASYAFLFAASYASHRSAGARVMIFLAVLPFAQLVPLFTWLESLHLPLVDRALQRFGLHPSSSETVVDAGDSLWGFLQSKYQSHAGFLVEAFVEAVPQAVLQTVFVVVTGQATALNGISVAMSVLTIASKGFLVSYALDYVTFAFNFLCIIADCFGLFAGATLLARQGLDGSLSSAVASLSASGVVLSTVAGHGLLWFTIMDDHLKLRDLKRWPHGVRGVSNSSVIFDLYITRVTAWLLAIIPCMVLFFGVRLSLLPICVLKSVDPDLVRHARFFRGLTHFLHGTRGGGGCASDAVAERDARLWTVNVFVVRARHLVERQQLMKMLKGSSTCNHGEVVRRWASNVGTSLYFSSQGNISHAATAPDAWCEDDAVQRAILESITAARCNGVERPDNPFAALQSRIRRLQVVAWLERTRRHAWNEMMSRSELFRWFSDRSKEQHRRSAHHRAQGSATNTVLRGLAVLAFAMTVICALPLALGHSLFIVLASFFPIVRAISVCGNFSASANCSEDVAALNAACAVDSGSCPSLSTGFSANESLSEASLVDAVLLPCGLAACYTLTLVSIAVIAPFVARRQLVWAELADLHGLPEAFYSGPILAEIQKRHLRNTLLRRRLGHFLAQHALSFLEH